MLLKAPHVMTKLLPPTFLFHFAPWFEISFLKIFQPFFPHRVAFDPPGTDVFLILSKTILFRDLGFLALYSVHHDTSYELSKTAFGQVFFSQIFRHKGGPGG